MNNHNYQIPVSARLLALLRIVFALVFLTLSAQLNAASESSAPFEPESPEGKGTEPVSGSGTDDDPYILPPLEVNGNDPAPGSGSGTDDDPYIMPPFVVTAGPDDDFDLDIDLPDNDNNFLFGGGGGDGSSGSDGSGSSGSATPSTSAKPVPKPGKPAPIKVGGTNVRKVVDANGNVVKYEFSKTFDIPDGQSGIIVQHIIVTFPDGHQANYYEAWTVTPGQSITDYYTIPASLLPEGASFSVVSAAQFFEGANLNDNFPELKPSGVPEAGGLYSSTDKPANWSDAGLTGEDYNIQNNGGNVGAYITPDPDPFGSSP